MSTPPQTDAPLAPEEPASAPSPSRRRRLLIAAAAAVVVVAVVLLAVLTGRGDDATSPAAAAGTESAGAGPTAAPTTGASISSAPATGTGTADPTASGSAGDGAAAPAPDPAQAPPSLAPVALDAPVPLDQVVVSLTSIEAIDGEGQGPGNIAGPALRVTVHLANRTDGALPVDGVAVSVAYGADHTPASPLEDPSRFPFGGSLAAGEEADGVYVFSVPTDQRDSVTVSVGYTASAPVAVFTGTAG